MEIRVDSAGLVRIIYFDGLEKLALDFGRIVNIHRISHVEWEGAGWTVRSTKNPELAIREGDVVSTEGQLAFFPTKEAAIVSELNHAWEL